MKNEFKDELLETIAKLESMLNKFPEPVRKKLKKDIEDLKRLLNNRNPRLMIAGRRGSGKSSMINAFVGEEIAKVGHIKAKTGQAKWYDIQKDDQVIEIIDTRGLGEGSDPNEFDTAIDPRESLTNEIKARYPDVILFTCKAKEVDARISEDLDDIEFIVGKISEIHSYNIPIIAVITHCDELTPKNIRLHNEKDSQNIADYNEKLERVVTVENNIHKQVSSREYLSYNLIKTIGISAYMSWRENGVIREDDRWRIEELLNYIFEELPDEAKLEFARITKIKKFQKKITDKITFGISSICAAIASTPIPVGDLAPITSLQISMIIMIAYVGGKKPSMKTAKEFLGAIGANIGAAFLFREAARALIKYIFPGGGNAISATIAYAATFSVGRAATAYFIDGVSKKEAKEIYKKTRKKEQEKAVGDKVINTSVN